MSSFQLPVLQFITVGSCRTLNQLVPQIQSEEINERKPVLSLPRPSMLFKIPFKGKVGPTIEVSLDYYNQDKPPQEQKSSPRWLQTASGWQLTLSIACHFHRAFYWVFHALIQLYINSHQQISIYSCLEDKTWKST